jgi:nitroreductase
MDVFEAGLAAPSGCNKQTTRLIAVDDPAVLKELLDTGLRTGRSAPAMVCVLTKRILAYRDVSFFVQDYSAAIQNMLLAIVALGYQSCWVEGQVTGTDKIGRKMADVLNVPDDWELVCFLPVGIADESLTHVKKASHSERAWFNGYHNG